MLLINLFAIISLVSFSAILLFRKNNATTNILLALIISNPAINFINNVFILTGAVSHFPEIVFISFITCPLYAPLVLAYCRKMIGKDVHLISWLHGLTLVLIVIDIGWYFQFLTFSSQEKQAYLSGLSKSIYPWQLNFSNALFTLVQLLYIIIATIEVFRFKKASQQFFANAEKIKTSYVLSFAMITCGLTVVLLLCYMTLPTQTVEYIAIPLICIVVYIFVLYNAFHKSVIFVQKEYDDFAECLVPLKRYDEYSEPLCKEMKEMQANPGKHKMAEAEIDAYHKKISEYMEKGKPYLHADISLKTLSEAIGACSHHVSMTINMKYEKNFFNLINSYRVEEAKQLLEQKTQSTTIEQIGYEVGFQTKSTFYTAFKTHTGTTPSAYVKLLENNNK